MHSDDEMVYLRDVVETLIYMTDDFCSYGEMLVKTDKNHEKVTRKE